MLQLFPIIPNYSHFKIMPKYCLLFQKNMLHNSLMPKQLFRKQNGFYCLHCP